MPWAGTLAWLVTALGILPATGIAKATPESGIDDSLEEVTITARGVGEPGWSVPLSISTVSGEQLERQGIQNLAELALAVPGLSFTAAPGRGGVPVLRGMSAYNISSNQNNVATVYNGLYVANAFAIDLNLLDLDHVEVLRGPQNALIGRNAFAGALVYVPAQPTPVFQANGRFSAGGDGFASESGFVSGPLSPTLTVRVAGMHQDYDGSIQNPAASATTLGGATESAATAAFLFRADPDFSAQLSGQWAQSQRDANARFFFGNAPPFYNCGRDPASGRYLNYCGAVPDRNIVDISPDARGAFLRTAMAELSVRWSLPFGSFSSLTGFRSSHENDAPQDQDLTSAGILVPVAQASDPGVITGVARANIYYNGFPLDDHEWSEELRLNGVAARGRWQLGAYAADNHSLLHAGGSTDARGLAPGEVIAAGLPGSLTPLTLIPYALAPGRNRIGALFGSSSYNLSERLDVSVELRWSREQILSEDLPVSGGPPDFSQSGSWAFLTPRLTLTHRWDNETLGYVSVAQGARSGGFNYSPLAAEQRFGAEKNWTYETGVKTGGATRQWQASAVLYWVTWSDLQRSGPSADPANLDPVTRNVGAALVRGTELTAQVRATRWLELRAEYAYASARFREGTVDADLLSRCAPDICVYTTVAPSLQAVPQIGGHHLPLAPQQSAFLSATAHGSRPDQRHWYFEAGVSLASRQYVDTDNRNWLSGTTVGNVQLGLSADHWEAALWGRNLSGKRSVFAVYGAIAPGGNHFVADPANGAYWGMSVTFNLH